MSPSRCARAVQAVGAADGVEQAVLGTRSPPLVHRLSRPLRWHLTMLIAGAVLPVVAFSGLVVLQRASQR
ncbi:uncharacterized protein STAUR_1849 [Stigmatella aurantiaca DW4/3-1]|uniref:Uncharacterized protein n=1 Tax=Stigmatella aurantiaca (strain DW4/3-1) TaxID=378806 RepID=E3FTN9_STIAD|nr:uncharacterized protein STAUR_1849 [Stigmatella aurantiaca DW4/3-1]